ncbi:MAG: site-specific integrase [Bacillota bacterium]|nr:site-specific integrase [Bacillota bacterium]
MGQKAGQKSRGNGEGNIRQKPDGRWEARITIGRTESGKQKMKYFYGHTRDEAAAKLNDFLSENQHGTYIEPSKYTVDQWLDEWYNNHVVGSVKPSTRVSYEMIIRQHLKPNFGHYKLKDLGSGTIQSVYNKMLKSGRVVQKNVKNKKANRSEKNTNKGLSEKTIRNIHLVLRKALQVAYLNDMIPKNPAADGRVTLPETPKKKDIRVFDTDEQKAIEKACNGQRWGMIILLDLYSGMRQGEILALTWKDIDFEKRTIKISKQLSRLKNFDLTIPGKTVLSVQPYTKNSNDRVISISPAIVDKLKAYKTTEDTNKAKWAEAYKDNNLVFCREDGHFVEPKTFQEFFKRTLKDANVADGNVHALRHTFATRALEAGIPVKVVSKILGHSSIQITLDTYSHVLPELQEEAMQIITDEFLELDGK